MKTVKPMLAKLQNEAFVQDNFIWEQKYDGARIIAVVQDGNARLFSRSGKEKTSMFPEIKIETVKNAILDGEIISGNSFNDMQHRFRQNGVSQAVKEYPAKYAVFDILECSDIDLRSMSLWKRKEILKLNLKETNNVTLAPYVQDGVTLFNFMKEHQLEGVIGKPLSSPYIEGNRTNWLKVKTWQKGVFLAVGYTKGTGWRENLFGALVLSDVKGNYVGSVGTGFDDDMIKQIMNYFYPGPCPFPREPEPATWIIPFAIDVQYLEYTNDGKLRFPSFKGMAESKPKV